MIILRLWATMRQPRYYKHPVFRRILLHPGRPPKPNVRILIGVGGIVGMLLLCGLSYALPSGLLQPFVLLPLILPFVLVAAIMGGTGKGLWLASEISAAVSREHQGDTFNVLASLPGGKLGIHWLILTAHVHRNGDIENTNEYQKQITIWGFYGASFLLLILYLNAWTAAASAAFVDAVFLLYGLVALYYIDYVCSLVTGVLVGALTATYQRQPHEARAIAGVFFLAIQGISFTVTYVLAVRVLPQFLSEVALNIWLTRAIITGMSLLGYYLLREALAWGLWRELTGQLEADATEQDLVTRI